MTDKDKIKEEIERQFDYYYTVYNMLHPDDLEAHISYAQKELLDRLFQFINSLPEEPANKDLEEEIDRYVYSIPHSADGFWPKDIDCYSQEARTKYGVYHYWSYEQVMNIARHFAEWQKQQMKETLQTEYEKGRFDMREEMIKDAVDGVVHHFANNELAAVHYNDPKGTPMSIYVSSKGLSAGDKVKIIILKTE